MKFEERISAILQILKPVICRLLQKNTETNSMDLLTQQWKLESLHDNKIESPMAENIQPI